MEFKNKKILRRSRYTRSKRKGGEMKSAFAFRMRLPKSKSKNQNDYKLVSPVTENKTRHAMDERHIRTQPRSTRSVEK